MSYPQVPLKSVAHLAVSNVDKKISAVEHPVRLANYVDVYYHDVLTGDLDYMEASASLEEIEKFTLRGGETIITKDSESPDDIGVAAFVAPSAAGLVCGYHLAILRRSVPDLDEKFLFWTMASRFVSEQLSAMATGVTRFGLRQDSIRIVRVPLPPIEEQRRISSFLDKEAARIDEVIAAKRASIRVFDERVSALRSEIARTLEGERHVSLRYAVRVEQGYSPSNGGLGNPREWHVLGLGSVRSGQFTASGLKRVDDQDDVRLANFEVVEGDLLLSRANTPDLVGVSAVVREPTERLVYPDLLYRIVPRVGVNREYLEVVLNARAYLAEIQQRAAGTNASMVKISQDRLKQVRIPLPDDDRQIEIARRQGEAVDMHRMLCRSVTASIERLEEYRRALITDVVTGRIPIPDDGARAKESMEEALA